MKVGLGALALLLCLVAPAKADVGLILNGSTPGRVASFTSAGHAAIYLSNVCPESPVKMRYCEPGEHGSVLSNYSDLRENADYQWNVVPLSVFLYGVEDPEDKPLLATANLRHVLADRMRDTRLREVCAGGHCPDEIGNWRDVIGAAFRREVYMFVVHTTPEQDRHLIDAFNARPNVNRYNGFTNNCADFARLVINTYFPGAARPNYMNDFLMTSPKAISRSFTHWAVKHPELQFHVVRFAQLPGEFPHSVDCRMGTEVAFRSKRWLFPLLLHTHELGLFAMSYTLTGRFNPHHELERRPTPEADALLRERAEAERQGDDAAVERANAALRMEREQALGTSGDWKLYENRFRELLADAIADGDVRSRGDLARFLRRLEEGTVTLDSDGSPWLSYTDERGPHRLGLTARTVLSPASDSHAASLFLLARMDAVLRERRKYREPWRDAQRHEQLAVSSRRPASDQVAIDSAAQEAEPTSGNLSVMNK